MSSEFWNTTLPTILCIIIPMIGSYIMGFIAGKSFEREKNKEK